MTIQTTVFLDATEISAEVESIQVRRGRSLETESFDAGGGSIRVENYDANFNPYFLNEPLFLLLENGDQLLLENGDALLLESGNGTSSGSYGDILAGRQITVVDGGVTVFTGYVEDLDFTWTGDLRATATLAVRDHLAALGGAQLNDWAPDQQLTGARVSALLDRPEVGFPSGASVRDIASGTQPLGAGVTTTNEDGTITYGAGSVQFGSNALRQLQAVNESENGRLFVDRTGKLTFQDRYAAFGLTSSASFDDTETNLPFHGIDVRFGTELLHFQVSATRDGGVTQTVTNAGAAAIYTNLGLRHLTRRTLLNSDNHTLGLATFLLERYGETRAVVSGLTVWLNDLSTAQRATVCALDIGDVISLTWTPQGTAGPVSQTLAIEGVTYSLRGPSAEMSFQLSDASDPDYFVVGADSVGGPALVAP